MRSSDDRGKSWLEGYDVDEPAGVRIHEEHSRKLGSKLQKVAPLLRGISAIAVSVLANLSLVAVVEPSADGDSQYQGLVAAIGALFLIVLVTIVLGLLWRKRTNQVAQLTRSVQNIYSQKISLYLSVDRGDEHHA